MAGFKNKEELLTLLLEDTQNVIEGIVKEIATGEGALDTLQIKIELENLHGRIETYKKLYLSETDYLK